MTLRAYLTALTLATLLPVAVFAAIVGYFLVEEQRETFRRGAEERTFALLTAVDAELKGSIDTIEALSAVASLTDGNLPYFRETAKRVLASQPHWVNINLALADRQRIMDLFGQEGAPLPRVQDFEGSFERLFAGAKACRRRSRPRPGDETVELHGAGARYPGRHDQVRAFGGGRAGLGRAARDDARPSGRLGWRGPGPE